jgi:hypothetical protein
MIKALQYCINMPNIIITHEGSNKTLARWSDITREWIFANFVDGVVDGKGFDGTYRFIAGSQALEAAPMIQKIPAKTRALVTFIDESEDDSPLYSEWIYYDAFEVWLKAHPTYTPRSVCVGLEAQVEITRKITLKA